MATYLASTTSNHVELSDPDAVEALLETYDFIPMHGELTVEVIDGHLACLGEAELQPYRVEEVDHPDERYDHVDVDGFLEELAPHLAEPFIAMTIGQEKCRFPYLGAVHAVDPDGEILKTSLMDLAREFEDPSRVVNQWVEFRWTNEGVSLSLYEATKGGDVGVSDEVWFTWTELIGFDISPEPELLEDNSTVLEIDNADNGGAQ